MKAFSGLLLFLFLHAAIHAQLTGTKFIGTDFATVASAISALNSQGVGTGGVIINIPAGWSETAPAGGYVLGSLTLNSSLSASSQLIIQKDPATTGANPLLKAFVGTGSTDGIFKILGADYVIISSIDLQESATNSGVKLMEWGFAILKSSATDGAQNISISHCTVQLDKTNTSSKGIYVGNHTSSSTSSLTITSISGINSNIKINGCTISNCYLPVSVTGYFNNTVYYDSGLEIGTEQGNTITDFGGQNSAAFGININGQNSADIENNMIFTNTSSLRDITGISISSACSGNIVLKSNKISIVSASAFGNLIGINSTVNVSSINISNNSIINCTYATGTSGNMYGIYLSSYTPDARIAINNNELSGFTYGSASTQEAGNLKMIMVADTSADLSIKDNLIFNNSANISSGNVFSGIHMLSGKNIVLNGNQVHDNVLSGSGSLFGIYNSSRGIESYTNNNIYSQATSGANLVSGIYSIGSAPQKSISGNKIYSFSSNGGVVYGCYFVVQNLSAFKNKFSDLVSTTTTGTAVGFYVNGSGTINFYNNMIGNINTPQSVGSNAVNGLVINGSGNYYIDYNTIYLHANSTGSTFGSSAFYCAGALSGLTLRNNLLCNNSIPASSGGYTTVLRYASNPDAFYAFVSDNNLLYDDNPSGRQLIYGETTGNNPVNPQQKLEDYQAFISGGRDAHDRTESPHFISTSINDPGFLHIDPSISSTIEGGGKIITNISDDIDGDVRSDSAPDIGADEFNGIQALPLKLILFYLMQREQKIILQWTTESEIKVKGFWIERSDNGVQFYSIGYVPAESVFDNDGQHKYEFTDTALPPNNIYYRLREQDIDGRTEISKTLKVFNHVIKELTIQSLQYDRSVQLLHIKLNISVPGKYSCNLYDLEGNLIQNTNTFFEKGVQPYTMKWRKNSIGILKIENLTAGQMCTRKFSVF